MNLIDATVASREQAAAREAARRLPVYYPRKLVPGSSFAEDAPRTYTISDPDDKRYRAYKMVIFTGFIGEYYGVQGTSWRDPPILESPSEKRKIGGREYLLFYNGDRLRLVGWKTERGVLLGLQHAAPDALREGDAGRRPLADASRAEVDPVAAARPITCSACLRSPRSA